MHFKKYIYDLIDANMYIAMCESDALIIDPNVNMDALTILKKEGIKNVLIILTHEHYDHISGVNWYRQYFNCKVLCSAECAKNIQSDLYNGSKFFSVLFINKNEELLEKAKTVKAMTCYADSSFTGSKKLYWNGHMIELFETPGHSSGSICIIIDGKVIFTGDSLLKNNKVVTKLPTGNRTVYQQKTIPFFYTLDGELWVNPGHGDGGFLRQLLSEDNYE